MEVQLHKPKGRQMQNELIQVVLSNVSELTKYTQFIEAKKNDSVPMKREVVNSSA